MFFTRWTAPSALTAISRICPPAARQAGRRTAARATDMRGTGSLSGEKKQYLDDMSKGRASGARGGGGGGGGF